MIGRTSASLLCGSLCLTLAPPAVRAGDGVLVAGPAQAAVTVRREGDQCVYLLTTTADLRDDRPRDKQVTITETPGSPTIRTGDVLFDGLYALAMSEAHANSVSQISDGAYANGQPVRIEAFQTGEFWKYVWTRDLSYALHLGLAGFDPSRAVNSLLFKASAPKASVIGGVGEQIVQDTGSGGSYPVSTDRVVWALGAHETLKYLSGAERQKFLDQVYPILCGTIEQDRRLVFDPGDGLYRGEQSFLDWREQTYPGWTRDRVLAIAMSKALSVNAANYLLLTRAAEYARLLGKPAEQARYLGWADELKASVNRQFWDARSGLYSTYLLSDDGSDRTVRTPRYDLLGESLAILSGIADERQAAAILAHYPTGPHGPPVVWPQETTVPIYHNQGIWPFVTAYWLKAARQAGHAAAVDAGIQSLEQAAALNLSNLENLDFVTGRAQVKTGPRQGPEVNSRRQLWSVAGYLSMVQEIVFGLETSWDGLRFRPCITAALRDGIFGKTDVVEWRGFAFHGTQNKVRIHLPPVGSFARGFCTVARATLNGNPLDDGFVGSGGLLPANEWEIFLQAPVPPQPDAPLRRVDTSDERTICAPVQPRWQQGGVALANDRLVLTYAHDDLPNVTFSVYRDGQLCASGLRETRWTDPDSADYRETVHSYRVAAVDIRSGNTSHFTPGASYRSPGQQVMIPANALHGRGGNLVGNHHLENWGRSGDEILTAPLTVERRGTYAIRVEFSNGAGPVNTGITCAVKKLEVRQESTQKIIATGYVVMPQSGDWKRFDLSSAVQAEMNHGETYIVRLCEDAYSRNMSSLQSNARYTSAAGGGEMPYNFVNIAALHLIYSGQAAPATSRPPG